jgi:predicted RNA binding protein YcfA (HicA-like mRNA interferase family)
VNPRQFIKRVRQIGKRDGVSVLESREGKGSHSRLIYGNRVAIVPYRTGDIPLGTLYAMIEQLGLDKADF